LIYLFEIKNVTKAIFLVMKFAEALCTWDISCKNKKILPG